MMICKSVFHLILVLCVTLNGIRSKMKLLFTCLAFVCLLIQQRAAEEIYPPENDIISELDDDIVIALDDTDNPDSNMQVEELELRTSFDEKDISPDEFTRTNGGHDDEDDMQEQWTDEENAYLSHDSSHDISHDSSSHDSNNPLDWTTLDRGLEDLHNLINQIDEMAPSRTNASVETEETIEPPDKPKYPCAPRQLGNDSATNVTTTQAKIVNATELLELVTSKVDPIPHVSGDNSTTNTTDGHCVFVMFYAPWCKFSVASAPHFNAVGRAFADIDVIAVDAFQFRSLNARYGTVSVPNFLFFYNNKPVLRYNYSERNFDNFVEFLQNHTGLVANSSVNVSDIDYAGPVPSVISEEPDYALWFSGIFLLFWFLWLLKVQYGNVIATKVDGMVNYVRHIWRTGEFYEQVGDHEHVD